MPASNSKCLSIDDMNPNVRAMEYAVRGPLVIRAGEIEQELAKGVKKPFKEVIAANIGDCHAMGQIPITFIRQLLAMVSYPPLLDDPQFPEDIKKRARDILNDCRGKSIGSYSEATGLHIVRKHVAEFIQNRDGGIPSDWENIILAGGTSEAIKTTLEIFIADINGKRPGVLVPTPQYPFYSATIAEFNMEHVGYYLDESNNWGLDINELQQTIDKAREICHPRVIVIINPGNPTGQVLSRQNIEDVIKFAYKERLFIFADEVYQDNVYAEGSKFYSFKKVLMEMGAPYSGMELASFISCSKGYMGECGLRGGAAEIINMCPEVKYNLTKLFICTLCSTVLGQATMDCLVNPPKPGEESYELYMKERTAVLESLKVRAKMVYDAFNSFEGFSCNPVQGAMYVFPQIKLPPKAIEAAKKAGKCPDVLYASHLLEKTGICIVPGSGFGQREGTYHFRTTILPQPEKLAEMLQMFGRFHKEFVKEFK